MAYLFNLVKQSQSKLFIQFGGQGTTFLREMKGLIRDYPEIKPFFAEVCAILDEGLAYLRPRQEFLVHGFDLKAWLSGDYEPPESYLGTCTVALASVHIAQSAYFYLLSLNGYDPDDFLEQVSGMTGHSMGFHSAHLAALGLSGPDYFKALRKFLLFVLIGGYRCQEVFPIRTLPQATLALSQIIDGQNPSSLASVYGLGRSDLEADLAAFNHDIPYVRRLVIALHNTEQSLVIAGCEEDLVAFRQLYGASYDQRGVKWTFLEVSAPFHSHFLKPAWQAFARDQDFIGFDFTGTSVKVPVYSTETGQNIQEMGALYHFSFDLMTATPLNWQNSLKVLLAQKAPAAVADFGPGRFSPGFTKKTLEPWFPDLAIMSATSRSTLKIWLGK